MWYNLTHVDSALLDLDEVEPPGLRELEILHFFFSMTSRVLGYSNGALELINLAFKCVIEPTKPQFILTAIIRRACVESQWSLSVEPHLGGPKTRPIQPISHGQRQIVSLDRATGPEHLRRAPPVEE